MSQKKQSRAKSGSGGNLKRNVLWLRRRERQRPMALVLIACVCVVAIVAGYLLQGSALTGGAAASGEVAQSAIRLSEVMSENGGTLLSNTGDAPDWIEIENTGNLPKKLLKNRWCY